MGHSSQLFGIIASSVFLFYCCSSAPVQLIIDTDLGFDVDDVGAIAVGHALANQGHVDILGIVCNTGRDACIIGVDIINTYYGRKVPIGSFKGKFGSYTDNGQDGHYVNDIKSKFPHTVNSRNDVPDALDIFRNALKNAADRSVTIASIGELTNLQNLLRNEMALVKQKVKRVVYMDGGFNFGCADGAYGPNDECWKSAQYVVANMPSPEVEQIFQLHGDNHNGWWTGNNPMCGFNAHNPVMVAYSDLCKNVGGWCDNYGRDSWDLNTVYVAVMGAAGGGHCKIGSGVPAHYSVSDDGKTEYKDYNNKTSNMYDFRLADVSMVGTTIETLLCQKPGPPTPTPPPTPSSPTPGPPPTPSPPPTPATSGWVPNSKFNCYGARGGNPAHGAKDLENPPDSSCGVMSISDCQKKCVNTTGCDGVTVSKKNDLYNCYRKGDINLAKCDHDEGEEYNTYVRGAWVQGSGFNCYGARGGNPAHGAKDLENPPDSSCGTMTISDCKKKCSTTKGCDGITVSKNGNLYNCYRKGDISLVHCDSHTEYDTYVHDAAF